MPTAPKKSSQAVRPQPLNVVQRLQASVGRAERMGFEVRKVVLDEQAANWCQIGTKKILFLDLSATAGEQLRQLDEILDSFEKYRQGCQVA